MVALDGAGVNAGKSVRLATDQVGASPGLRSGCNTVLIEHGREIAKLGVAYACAKYLSYTQADRAVEHSLNRILCQGSGGHSRSTELFREGNESDS